MTSRLLGACAAWLCLAPLPAYAAPEGVAQANESYRQGRYAEAVSGYTALVERQPDNPGLRYNLANAYFKKAGTGDFGRSVAEYWRAYRLKPRDSDIRYNFDFALKRAGDSLVPSGTPKEFHWLFYCLSDVELLGLQWLGYWLTLLLATAAILLPDRREGLKPYLAGAAVAWALVGSWWGLRLASDVSSPGVVLESSAEARSGPGPNFPVSFNAPEGRRVSILSKDGDWVEIGVLKEGLKGWVSARSVERL
ncbi:MAG: tetratricopeptide repeat protein [Elusimicrobia bacterium]|nr:tetratricopeptide repeat protein [Elusimicrobiota bacterium]